MEEVVALGAPVQILPSRPNSWLCASRKTEMPMVNLKEIHLEAISNPAPTKTTAQNSNAGGESQRDTPRGKPSNLNSPAYKWKRS